MISMPPAELNCSSTGATDWTYFSSRKRSPMRIGMGAPLKARNADAEGGCSIRSAPTAFNALGGLLQHAAGETNDNDHQRDLNADGEDADQRAQGPVQQVAEHQLSDHCCAIMSCPIMRSPL